jgi:predicted transcriptional regulator
MQSASSKSKKRVKLCNDAVNAAGFSSVSVENFHAPFDIIAGRNGRSLILKAVRNIDSITPEDGKALSKLSYFFDAEAYVVGESYKGTKLEESKVFTRHGISCISDSTLEIMLYNGSFRLARKFFRENVEINGGELKRLRKLSGMSRKQLSEISEVSVDSIYRYENGYTSASPLNLEKLEKALSAKLSVNQSLEHNYNIKAAGHGIALLDINKEPFKKALKDKTRFEFAELADFRTLKKWSDFYKAFNAIFDDIQFIITKKEMHKKLFGIPTISKRKLYSLEDTEELYELAEEST